MAEPGSDEALLAELEVLRAENAHLKELERKLEARGAALEQARDDAEAASRSKSAFLANMSHELRTPLNAVLGHAQLLQRDPSLGARQREGVETIRRSGEHLLTLINDILDLARIEADRLELHPAPFAWSPFLTEIAELFRIQARQKGLTFAYQIRSELPAGVLADETRLRQVLLNLLGNAVKFTRQGGVTFRVRWEAGRAELEVIDTGPGIPRAERERIFEPFRQAGERKLWIKGTGLGLAITRRLVEMMGGEVRVESQLGYGSRFRVSLPLPEAEPPDTLAPDAPERAIIGYEGDRRSVLVVDDNAENRSIIRLALEPLGFEVREAADGYEGLESARRSAPDLVLLDLVMPRMDGFEALRQLRADPRLVMLPVVVTSASVFREDKLRSSAAGSTDFLPKPVDVDLLLAMLAEQLELRWLLAGPAPAAPAEAPPAPGAAARLPPDRAAALVEHARSGDVAGLPELAPLAARVRDLARDFDLEAIAALGEEGAG
jgi:signal transduction histidine kinase/DNA-binding NarL/FixJ family response regulator